MAIHGRKVTNISSCRVYGMQLVGGVRTEQPGSLGVGFILLLFPIKVEGGHSHSNHGRFLAPGPY